MKAFIRPTQFEGTEISFNATVTGSSRGEVMRATQQSLVAGGMDKSVSSISYWQMAEANQYSRRLVLLSD